MSTIRHFLKNDDGPSSVEYAFMLALIVLAAAAAISTLGANMGDAFQSLSNLG